MKLCYVDPGNNTHGLKDIHGAFYLLGSSTSYGFDMISPWMANKRGLDRVCFTG